MWRDGLRLLLMLPDGSRSLIPAEWTDLAVRQEGPATANRTPSADGTAVPVSLGRLADLLHARIVVNALSSAASPRHRTRPLERRTCVQLNLAFLDDPPAPPGLWERLDSQTRAAAVEVLARLIAQVVLAAMP